MKNKKDIEFEVAQLTQEQKNTVLKIGKLYPLVLALVFLPAFIFAVWNFFKVIQVEKYGNSADSLMLYNIIALSAVLVYAVVSLIFVRIKFPFYSDKKYKYLKKNKDSDTVA